jgi:hypothetical protein
VTDLVGKAIAQNGVSEGTRLPYIIFSVNRTPVLGLDGTKFCDQVDIRAECWAANALAADEVADAVEVALTGGPPGQATVTARASGFDGDLGLDATVLTIDWWSD